VRNFTILGFSDGRIVAIHRFFGLSRKKYNIFKQLVKKIREITEVDTKSAKAKNGVKISAKVNKFQDADLPNRRRG
jgi:hypothetical protein